MWKTGAWSLALLVALAGCIGALGDSSTGMSLNEDANEQAQAWDEDATLVGVSGAETEANTTPPEDQAAYNASEGEIGDGQAPAWNYTYENDEEALSLLVAANGTVIDRETHRHHDRTPITGWEIDSTEAIEALEDANETWANATPHTAFYGLSQNSTSPDPFWGVMILEEDAPALLGLVNATTGDVLEVSTFEFDLNFTMDPIFGADAPDPEHGSFDGTLTLPEPQAEHAFQIHEDGHEELAVVLQLEDPAASTVAATLEGPNGTTGSLQANPASSDDEITWDEPAPGSYEVHLEMEQGLTQDYRLEWCAHTPDWFTGPDLGPFGDANAC